VTPGGLVQMEIEQEVSTVAQTDSSALDSPTLAGSRDWSIGSEGFR